MSAQDIPGAPCGQQIARLDVALTRAREFLVARQDQAGRWVDFELPVGRATAWTTAYVATMLAPGPAARLAVQRAGRWLVAAYRPGQAGPRGQPLPGGWGYNEQVPPDGDSTAWALLALAAAGLAPTDAMRWALTSYRLFSGLYRTYADRLAVDTWTAPHVDVTAVALQALLTMGTAEARPIEVTVERLLERAARGEWHAYWWADDAYAAAQALQALADFRRWCAGTGYGAGGHPAEARVAPLLRGVDELLDAYRQQAGWVAAGDEPFGAALRVRAWAAIGGAMAVAWPPVERLLAAQAADGRWPGGPKLRLTHHDSQQPWATPGSGVLYADVADIFTTATVVGALHLVRGRLATAAATSRFG
ncbi:MAG TPA: hypothetical protein VII06_12110 [Chloroflexota bacterium]|jgi:hypothetical protein